MRAMTGGEDGGEKISGQVQLAQKRLSSRKTLVIFAVEALAWRLTCKGSFAPFPLLPPLLQADLSVKTRVKIPIACRALPSSSSAGKLGRNAAGGRKKENGGDRGRRLMILFAHPCLSVQFSSLDFERSEEKKASACLFHEFPPTRFLHFSDGTGFLRP